MNVALSLFSFALVEASAAPAVILMNGSSVSYLPQTPTEGHNVRKSHYAKVNLG